ncbi:MAG: DoxX family protein, partial [Chitinophagaceae bacterium]
MQAAIDWLNRNKDLGVLFLRLFIGIRLVYGVLDNVFDWKHMMLFRDFLDTTGFPLPLVSAVVSVYAQLFAGIMILLGWKIRIAALLMIINFLIAVLMVHLGQSFEQMTPALAM